MKIQIIPAILPHDFAELSEKVEQIQGFAKMVQVDICDGHFVPSFTWPYKKHDDSFERIIHEDDGLPGWKDLEYEFDLMVDHPEKVIDEWVSAGASRIIIHAEAKGDVAGAIESLQGRVEIGVALNMETPLKEIFDSRFKIQEGHVQFIQLMGIDNVGYQGQKFDEKVVGRIKEARLLFPGLPISVDGGISLENARSLADAGADRLIVGSAIFNGGNAIQALADFKEIL